MSYLQQLCHKTARDNYGHPVSARTDRLDPFEYQFDTGISAECFVCRLAEYGIESARYRSNRVTVPSHQKRDRYCAPRNTGGTSTDKYVANQIRTLLDCLDELNAANSAGDMAQELTDMRRSIIAKLKADGWAVSVGQTTWRIVSPDDQ